MGSLEKRQAKACQPEFRTDRSGMRRCTTGALDVQLAGNAYYFGKLYPKETIGDDVRPIEPEDILRAGNLMDGTALLTLLVFGLLKYCMILM